MLNTTLFIILISIIFVTNPLQHPNLNFNTVTDGLFFKIVNKKLETMQFSYKINFLPLFYSTSTVCQDFQVNLDENLLFEFQAHKIKQNVTAHVVQGRISLNVKSNKDKGFQKCTSSDVKIVCPKSKDYCATLSKPAYRKFIKLDKYIKMIFEGSLDDSSCDFYESKDSLLPFKTDPGSFNKFLNKKHSLSGSRNTLTPYT